MSRLSDLIFRRLSIRLITLNTPYLSTTNGITIGNTTGQKTIDIKVNGDRSCSLTKTAQSPLADTAHPLATTKLTHVYKRITNVGPKAFNTFNMFN